MADTGTPSQNRTRRSGQPQRAQLDRQHASAPLTTEGVPGTDYVTVAEVPVLLRVCTKTVHARIKSGDLEGYRHGRRIIIPRSAIESLIKSGRVR
jgi:excisionase family DNA binding protein